MLKFYRKDRQESKVYNNPQINYLQTKELRRAKYMILRWFNIEPKLANKYKDYDKSMYLVELQKMVK